MCSLTQGPRTPGSMGACLLSCFLSGTTQGGHLIVSRGAHAAMSVEPENRVSREEGLMELWWP